VLLHEPVVPTSRESDGVELAERLALTVSLGAQRVDTNFNLEMSFTLVAVEPLVILTDVLWDDLASKPATVRGSVQRDHSQRHL
jgi:hypothetical protein